MKTARLAQLGLLAWGVAVSQITFAAADPLAGSVPQLAEPISDITGAPEPDVIQFLLSLEWPANLLLFLPLGLLLPLATGWRILRVSLVAAASTMVIESAQFLALVGREASAFDLLANFSGALCGYAAYRFLVSTFLRKHSLDGAKHQVDVKSQ